MKRKMPIPVDLFPQIMSHNLDYQVISETFENEKFFYFPRRICKMFLFALQNGDDRLSTMIIKDAREKLKRAIHLRNHGDYDWNRSLPNKFSFSFEDGKYIFTGYHDYWNGIVTEQVMKFLKPTMVPSREGFKMEFQAPEQLIVEMVGSSQYTVHLDPKQCAMRNRSKFFFVSDWLFHFLVEGKDYGVQNLSASSESFRKLRYAKNPQMGTSRIDQRNKRKKVRDMLQSWKNKHPTLFGRMDIKMILRKIFYCEDINLHNAVYSL